MFACTHTHTHVTNIIKEKGAINLRVGEYRRGSKEGNWKGLAGGKRGSDIILFQLKTLTN